MISVILYGRNDSHGYNLHKRAAISLNCIAEVLGEPDDEILFVDYNTPNDLPTFIEAIYDTLTPEAKSRLRVFRVRPELHARLVGPTHLYALEPHSRNVAIRRSNQHNRWVLFTNSDMIFLPRPGFSSLAAAVQDLPDGQYVTPRFDLPEPLWESFPRSDPRAIMRLCEELGPKLHLEEVALRVPFMRFDSPGDFQLAPRQALFDMHGFDERMIHGWHADSNMCKRLYLFYGSRTESLGHRVKAYHCDHTRVATLAHRLDIKLENSLQQFVYSVEDPVAHHQAETWGAPGEVIEELDFTHDPAARFVCALEHTLSTPSEWAYQSNANDLRNYVFYQQEHALPYVAGNLTVYPPEARFAYVGNNPRMLDLTARCVEQMGFRYPLQYAADLLTAGGAPPGASPIPGASGADGLYDQLLANQDLLIFDFGLDPAGSNLANAARVTDWPRDLRYSLGAVARCLEKCAERSDALSKTGARVPDFLVLNANHHVFAQFMAQFLIAADTPYPTHVRKGQPRPGEERLYKASVWKFAEDAMRSYFAYDEEDLSLPVVAPGHAVDLTSQGRPARYKDGDWGAMDYTGSWIDGYRAAIVFQPDPSLNRDLVAYFRITEGFLNLEDQPNYLQVFFEGELLARWTIYMRFEITRAKVILPKRLMAGKAACRLEFRPENPQSAQQILIAKGQPPVSEDPRELSIKVQQITFTGLDRLRCPLNQNIDFTRGGDGACLVDECWTSPDDLGTWTLGPHATLDLEAPDAEGLVSAVFTITDAVVTEAYPEVGVTVAVSGRELATWTLRSRFMEQRRILIPAPLLPAGQPVNFCFQVDAPRTPKQLGWHATDKRPLGIRLTRLYLSPQSAKPCRLGEVIDFAEGGDSITFVGDGLGSQWTAPDAYGSWTIGSEASLRVPFQDAPTTGIPAAFVISDCNVGGSSPTLAVRVKANGAPVAEWVLGPEREPHQRSIHLPAEVLSRSPELTLTFEIPGAHGGTEDPRPLGIRLARAVFGSEEIELAALGPQPPPRRPMIRRILGLPFFAVHVARIVLKMLIQKWSER
ncbi:MAG TPA: hypothetical protein VEV17_25750 [Bryobacteraceae bacterium]|nr:hypothetical protein [Bryobacteraceae bacterium]